MVQTEPLSTVAEGARWPSCSLSEERISMSLRSGTRSLIAADNMLGLVGDNFDVILELGTSSDERGTFRCSSIKELAEKLKILVGCKVLLVAENSVQGEKNYNVHEFDLRFERRSLTEDVFSRPLDCRLPVNYEDCPNLYQSYLAYLEDLKVRTELLGAITEHDDADTLRQLLIADLDEMLTHYHEDVYGARPGIPSTKLMLAQAISNSTESGILTLDDVENYLGRISEYLSESAASIPLLPSYLQREIGSNDLITPAIETSQRLRIVSHLRGAVEEHVRGFSLLGSVSWGANCAVTKASDVDTEIFFQRKDFQEFYSQLPTANIAHLPDESFDTLVRDGRGRIFSTIRALHREDFIPGATKDAGLRALFLKFAVFSSLQQSSVADCDGLDDRCSKVGTSLVDYLSMKVTVDATPVSVHVVAKEGYEEAALSRLSEATDGLVVLHELRVGERKQASSNKVTQDFTYYGPHYSFDGVAHTLKCPVYAVLPVSGGHNARYSLKVPSTVSPEEEKEVLGWLTQVPVYEVKEGKMIHGVIQDKLLWGKLGEAEGNSLNSAIRGLTSELVERFEHEVESGRLTSSKSSLLNLSNRAERLSPFVKVKRLLELSDASPEMWDRYLGALRTLGGEDLVVATSAPVSAYRSSPSMTLESLHLGPLRVGQLVMSPAPVLILPEEDLQDLLPEHTIIREGETKLVLVRHGETVDNVEKVLSGSRNAALSENGHDQASKLFMRLRGVPFDSIIASNLDRAVETVRLIAEYQGLTVKQDERLRERSFGEFEGKEYETLKSALAGSGNSLVEFKPREGESLHDVEVRARSFLSDLFSHHRGESVLIAAHAGYNRVLLSVLLGLALEESPTISQRNTCVNVIIVRQDGTVEPLAVDSTVHL